VSGTVVNRDVSDLYERRHEHLFRGCWIRELAPRELLLTSAGSLTWTAAVNDDSNLIQNRTGYTHTGYRIIRILEIVWINGTASVMQRELLCGRTKLFVDQILCLTTMVKRSMR